MTGNPDVIDALQLCGKYERTLIDCFRGYAVYFKRWRLHRPAQWFAFAAKLARKRLKRVDLRLQVLDTIPANDRFDFELEPVVEASDILETIAYFIGRPEALSDGLLREARVVHEEGRRTAMEAGDSVSAKLMGMHKAELEDAIQRMESKRRKIQQVGPELYLAVHFRGGQGRA